MAGKDRGSVIVDWLGWETKGLVQQDVLRVPSGERVRQVVCDWYADRDRVARLLKVRRFRPS